MTAWVEVILRFGTSVAAVVCAVGLATTLGVPPGLMWAGGVLVSVIVAGWLWRRWLDRWEEDRDRKRHLPDRPYQASADVDEPKY